MGIPEILDQAEAILDSSDLDEAEAREALEALALSLWSELPEAVDLDRIRELSYDRVKELLLPVTRATRGRRHCRQLDGIALWPWAGSDLLGRPKLQFRVGEANIILDEELHALNEHGEDVLYPEKAIICRKMDTAEVVFVLRSGRVLTYKGEYPPKENEDGVTVLEAVNEIGLIDVLGSRIYTVTAIALSDVRLWKVHVDVLNKVMGRFGRLVISSLDEALANRWPKHRTSQ